MNIKSLDIIHEEHRALGAMLSGLRTLAREIEAGRLQPDFDLLASMIEYIEKVPEKVHHPKENDYLFAKLRRGLAAHRASGRRTPFGRGADRRAA